MTTLSDKAFNSLIVTEGWRDTIYKDIVGIPTVGMGVALLVKNAEKKFIFRSDLKGTAEKLGLNWENCESALEDARDVLNGIEGKTNPFKTATQLLDKKTNEAESEKYGHTNQTEFKKLLWPKLYNEYLSIVRVRVGGFGVWNRLSLDEQTAMFSMCYNSPSLVGNTLKNSLILYTEDGMKRTDTELTDSQFVGKLHSWFTILYASNGNNVYGLQNRRFFEANEFLGKIPTQMPLFNNAKSVLEVDNDRQAAIAVAYMNQRKTVAHNKMNAVTGYNRDPYKYLQENFTPAIKRFLESQGHDKPYDISKLFKEWNLLNDLEINTSTGAVTYKKEVTGGDKDLIFKTQEEKPKEADKKPTSILPIDTKKYYA